MMSLADMQKTFMGNVLDEAAAMPEGWGNRHAAGLQVYRGNYRTALVEALRDTFLKTEEWAGEGPFKQAAINHVIAHSSSSWTIDDVGAGFDETCRAFFSASPEVAELAWLEWTMLRAFSSPDTDPLTLDQFGLITSEYGDAQWLGMKIELVPDLAGGLVRHDLHAMWRAMDDDNAPRPAAIKGEERGVLVWREEERPTFELVSCEEVAVVDAVREGQSYGDICAGLAGAGASPEQAQDAAMRAGGILGRWVQNGFVTALRTTQA